jgi:lysozyme family protein
MNTSFARALDLVLKEEGGFVDNPNDPGGATNKGITIGTFRQWVKPGGTVADLKAITPQQVATVYRHQYWDAIKGDDLPAGVDYAVFDFAVNSGVGRAARYLQRIAGVPDDGAIGNMTLAAVRGKPAAFVIGQLCDSRLAFLRGLATWSTFGKGWGARVERVRAAAFGMVQ